MLLDLTFGFTSASDSKALAGSVAVGDGGDGRRRNGSGAAVNGDEKKPTPAAKRSKTKAERGAAAAAPSGVDLLDAYEKAHSKTWRELRHESASATQEQLHGVMMQVMKAYLFQSVGGGSDAAAAAAGAATSDTNAMDTD